MKKTTMFTVAISSMLFVALSGCESNNQKTQEAKENVSKATDDLAKAQLNAEMDSMKLVDVAEWELFKNETDSKIQANEIRIAYLRKSLKQSKLAIAKDMNVKISELEEKSKELKSRLLTYDQVQGDWIEFKREFSKDMDQLGSALTNFTVPTN
jgi:hypothetical protein